MTRGTTATMTALGLIAACLALAGCTAASTPDAGPASPAPSPTPSPSAECILGDWIAGAEQLQPAYDRAPGGLQYPAAEIAPEATAALSFADDGTFAFEQSVPVALTWMEHLASVELGGTLTGAYEASAGALTMTADANALTVTASDDSRASRLFAMATEQTLMEWPVSAKTYDCDGDTLVLGLETEGHSAAVEFTRP